ncbi:MAG: hypothetical protein R2860_07550 [Desulfobacterales bacterium]
MIMLVLDCRRRQQDPAWIRYIPVHSQINGHSGAAGRLARAQLMGFHFYCLAFVLSVFSGLRIFPCCRLTVQSAAEARSAQPELDNYKLQQLGMALQNSEVRYRNVFDNNSAGCAGPHRGQHVDITG